MRRRSPRACRRGRGRAPRRPRRAWAMYASQASSAARLRAEAFQRRDHRVRRRVVELADRGVRVRDRLAVARERAVHRPGDRERPLAAADVRAGRLAGLRGRAPRAEDVVAHLEREPVRASHPAVRARALGGRARGERAELARRGEQCRRLALRSSRGTRRTSPTARSRSRCPRLGRGTARRARGAGRSSSATARSAPQARRTVEQRRVAERAHRVAGRQRGRDTVAHPERRAPVAQLVSVLDVVVDEREVVQQLDRGRRGERVFRRRAFGLRDRDAGCAGAAACRVSRSGRRTRSARAPAPSSATPPSSRSTARSR